MALALAVEEQRGSVIWRACGDGHDAGEDATSHKPEMGGGMAVVSMRGFRSRTPRRSRIKARIGIFQEQRPRRCFVRSRGRSRIRVKIIWGCSRGCIGCIMMH